MENDVKNGILAIAIELYRLGPTQMNVWSRSGGDISFLYLGQAGRDAWYEAIERLAKGGGGREITPQALVAAMLEDYPSNAELIKLQRKLLGDEVEPSKGNETSVSNDELEYKTEEQFWFVADFPPVAEIPSAMLSDFVSEIDVLILTATEVELKYALARLKPLESSAGILKGVQGNETYYLGKFGAFNAVVAKCEMGLSGVNASILTTEEALRLWQPKAAFMVGIAFAKDASKQHIGEVLVAKSVIPYDNQRVGEQVVVHRGQPLPSDAALLNRFENAYDWKFVLPDGSLCKKDSGPILSAEKLVDSLAFRDALFKQFPNAVGGEMEGAGFYAAAYRKRVPCLLLKSICDWGDGKKHKRHQPLAAATACSLLYQVLSSEENL